MSTFRCRGLRSVAPLFYIIGLLLIIAHIKKPHSLLESDSNTGGKWPSFIRSASNLVGPGIQAPGSLLNNTAANTTNSSLGFPNRTTIGPVAIHPVRSSHNVDADGRESSLVVNPHAFEYVINSPNVCSDVQGDLQVIAYVHSGVDHYNRRMIIRQTWGSPAVYSFNFRLIFVMGIKEPVDGVTENTDLQNEVRRESEVYGDIVQENFYDTYRNLTYKGIASLRWITKYCPHAKFILKTDDDIFVNSFSLINHIELFLRQQRTQGFIMCYVWYNALVKRDGKWKISVEEWGPSKYPSYCSGSAFILAPDIAIKLYKISYYVRFFWVDDLYITGFLPYKLGGVQHIQINSSYVLQSEKVEEKFTGSQWYKYLFGHINNTNELLPMWRHIVSIHNGEFVPTIKAVEPGYLALPSHRIKKIRRRIV